MNRVREQEEDKLAYSGMSQPMQEKQAAVQGALVGANGNEKRPQEFVNFKMPKDLAIVSSDSLASSPLFLSYFLGETYLLMPRLCYF